MVVSYLDPDPRAGKQIVESFLIYLFPLASIFFLYLDFVRMRTATKVLMSGDWMRW